MFKLIDYIQLRRKGFSMRISWRTAGWRYAKFDAFLLIVWATYLIYTLLKFTFAINAQLIHKNEIKLKQTAYDLHALQTDNKKLEISIVALLNGEAIKVDDAYYVFTKKVDNSIN